MVTIYAHKTDPKAVIPTVAYNNTSAAFDITCTQETLIPAKGIAIVPCGLNLTIDQNDNHYMRIDLRSSMGFKKSLMCHPGIVDGGYTGDLSVKIFNLSNNDVIIGEGERYAQITVIEKPKFELVEMDDDEFEQLKQNQIRGDKGFGSSDK